MKFTLAIGCVVLLGLSTFSTAKDEPASKPAATSYTGMLKGGMMAIGGETTGWMLAYDGGWIMVDVAKVRADADKFNGKKCTVTGTVIEKQFVESGKKKVLVADSIKEPAAEK